MKLKHYLIGFFLILNLFVLAQNPAFYAKTNTAEVALDEPFKIEYVIENARGRFNPPKFNDFEMVGRPAQSSSTTILNGTSSMTLSYTYVLRPKKIGVFNIPKATFKLTKGKSLTCNEVRMKVVKARKSKATTLAQLQKEKGKDVFMTIELQNENAYLGQQLILDITIYTAVEINNYSLDRTLEIKGCYIETVENFPSELKEEVVEGKKYFTKKIHRFAVFPLQTGKITIDPILLKASIRSTKGRLSSFYNTIPIRTDPYSFVVKPLPSNAPETFSGAVGRFKINSSLANYKKISTDDAVSLKVSIFGNGDLKQLQTPTMDFGDSLEVYEPTVLGEKKYENNGNIEFRKDYEYLILPNVKGQYTVSPHFTYFDVDSAQYITLRPQSFGLNVLQGKNTKSTVLGSNDLSYSKNLAALKTNTSLSEIKDKALHKTPLIWGLLSLPIFAFLGMIGLKRYVDSRPQIDWDLKRFNEADQVAIKRLKKAKEHQNKKETRSFYDEISKVIFGYLGDKFKMPHSELDKKNIAQKLTDNNVAEHQIKQITDILSECEMALFAGVGNLEKMDGVYNQTFEVIKAIEKGFK